MNKRLLLMLVIASKVLNCSDLEKVGELTHEFKVDVYYKCPDCQDICEDQDNFAGHSSLHYATCQVLPIIIGCKSAELSRLNCEDDVKICAEDAHLPISPTSSSETFVYGDHDFSIFINADDEPTYFDRVPLDLVRHVQGITKCKKRGLPLITNCRRKKPKCDATIAKMGKVLPDILDLGVKI